MLSLVKEEVAEEASLRMGRETVRRQDQICAVECPLTGDSQQARDVCAQTSLED